MTQQPTGTVTLLFTDIEGSTQLLARLGPERYGAALELHRGILRAAFDCHHGYEVDHEGDAFFVAFRRAADAVAAAAQVQLALAAAEWPDGQPLRVRMGIHTGEPLAAPPKYVGLDVHKAARIMAAGHGGQVLLSSATYRLLDGTFEAVPLGEHRLKDLVQPEPLYQLHADGLETTFPALKTLGNRPTNLPVQSTPLIGRERGIADVIELLRSPETRLLTLTGPGGIGKTRLALQAAGEVVEEFASGVFFVALAPVGDPNLVVPMIARTLALRERRDEEPSETVAQYLEQKQLLLVLDNFEQVVDASGDVMRILQRCPEVKVMVTSRERLRVQTERTYVVPPLGLVELGADVSDVLASESVVLFASRAAGAAGGLVVDAATAPVVAQICARLDGLPLAIELAAARTATLSVDGLLQRLDRRLVLLTGGGRDVDERQRTLQATVAWSYDLLTEPEQTLFARLAVFVDGCRLDAAHAVCGRDRFSELDLLDVLTSLIEKNLVRQRLDPDGEPRFWMLQTIREFAGDRLAVAGAAESEETRFAHAVYYARLVSRCEADLYGPRQSATLQLLNVEMPNIRAALDRLHEDEDPRSEAALAADCSYYWYLSGQFRDGHRLVSAAYDRMRDRDAPERGRIANALALMSFYLGQTRQTVALADEAFLFCQRYGDTRGILRALVAKAPGDDYAGSRSVFNEMVTLAREAGEQWYLALALGNLGVCERELGNLDYASALMRESLVVGEPLGDRHVRAGMLCNLGHVERLMGELESARDDFLEALALFDHDLLPELVIWCLDGLASIPAGTSEAEAAAVFLGAAEALAAKTGYQHPQTDTELRHTRDALVDTLGQERFEELRDEGTNSRLSTVIELALDSSSRHEGTACATPSLTELILERERRDSNPRPPA